MKFSRSWQCAFTVVIVSLSLFVPTRANAADDEFAAMVKQRVQDWQPTKDERLLDQVGWASDLVEARRLAKKHQRPLFVFTYSGSTTRANAIALQRC
ncbi:MAG: hypothetical protein O3C40_00895 [Planctomycetota bacterium]|nr:hypothetical protein [Planctomycetota bacterium]